jgi:3-hydroxyisobutyrate dehydrogenase
MGLLSLDAPVSGGVGGAEAGTLTFMVGGSEAAFAKGKPLFDISSKASGQCWSLTTYCPWPGPVPTAPSNRDYEGGFAAAMMLKDLKLAQDAAETTGAPTPLGGAAEALYEELNQRGYGGKDFSFILEMLRGRT